MKSTTSKNAIGLLKFTVEFFLKEVMIGETAEVKWNEDPESLEKSLKGKVGSFNMIERQTGEKRVWNGTVKFSEDGKFRIDIRAEDGNDEMSISQTD